MVVPAGKKSANTMPSMSQKTVSMTITAEQDALVFFGDGSFDSFHSILLSLISQLPFHWLVFHFRVVHVKPSFVYHDKAIKEVGSHSKMFQAHGGTSFPFCPHIQGQNQRNLPRPHFGHLQMVVEDSINRLVRKWSGKPVHW